MMYADPLLAVGRAMNEPSSRYGILDLRNEHLTTEAEPYGWVAQAWAAIQETADTDEKAGKPRRLVPQRMHNVCPEIPMERWRQLDAVGETADAAMEQAAAVRRLIQRFQIARISQTAIELCGDAGAFLAHGRDQRGRRVSAERALERLRVQLANVEAEIQAHGTNTSVLDGESQAERFLAHQQEVRDNPGAILGLPSLGAAWDDIHGGAKAGRLGYTVAPSGSGKTFFFLNKATEICDGGTPGLYINNEMMPEDIDNRLACVRLARVEMCDDYGRPILLHGMERGEYGPEIEMEAAQRAESSGLMVTDNSPKTALGVASLLAQHAIKHGIKYAVVDHMLDVEMDEDEQRQGPQWKQHRKWLGLWSAVARRYGFTLEVIGMVGGANIVAIDGVEPDPYELQGAKATINLVDYFRVMWRNGDGDPVVTTSKNRGGTDWQRVRYEWDRPTGLMREKAGGFYIPPPKDEKGGHCG